MSKFFLYTCISARGRRIRFSGQRERYSWASWQFLLFLFSVIVLNDHFCCYFFILWYCCFFLVLSDWRSQSDKWFILKGSDDTIIRTAGVIPMIPYLEVSNSKWCHWLLSYQQIPSFLTAFACFLPPYSEYLENDSIYKGLHVPWVLYR